MTSNIGNKYVGRGEIIGFGDQAEDSQNRRREIDLKRALQDQFAPELLGRIDRVVVFKPLTTKELERIFAIEFGKLAARVKKRGVTLKLTPALVAAALSRRNPDSGARFVRSFIQDEIEPRVAAVLVARQSKRLAPTMTLAWKSNSVHIASR